MKKICVVTGSRAEYGLLRPIMDEIKKNKDLVLQLVVTGMHLSPEFGLTYREIENDGFQITDKVEMLLSSDTHIGISKAIGMGVSSFSEVLERLNPNIVIVLGDRFEIFSAVIASMNARIPIAHIHGGETGSGTVDNMLRHSITKMSTLHFVSTEQYRNRVIQLGEFPSNVFFVGAPGIENIKKVELLNKEELENDLGIDINERTIVVTFHPLSLEIDTAKVQFNELLLGLEMIKNLNIIFTKANADAGGRIINTMIDDYVNSNKYNSKAFNSLGMLRYLSLLKYVGAVVGNSSSGIVEAPSFGVYTLNIGDRQKGRIQADSIINCSVDKDDIYIKLTNILENKEKRNFKNPYEKEGTSYNIIRIIKERLDKGINIDKDFFDIEFMEE